MKTQLSDKTHVVTTRQGGRFYVTAKQANNVKMLLSGGGQGFVVVGESLIRVDDVNGVLTGEDIENADHQKRGEWKCKYDKWHERGQGCGHGLLPR